MSERAAVLEAIRNITGGAASSRGQPSGGIRRGPRQRGAGAVAAGAGPGPGAFVEDDEEDMVLMPRQGLARGSVQGRRGRRRTYEDIGDYRPGIFKEAVEAVRGDPGAGVVYTHGDKYVYVAGSSSGKGYYSRTSYYPVGSRTWAGGRTAWRPRKQHRAMPREQAIELLSQIYRNGTKRQKGGLTRDMKRTAAKVFDEPNWTWAANPGRYDVLGLDAPPYPDNGDHYWLRNRVRGQ